MEVQMIILVVGVILLLGVIAVEFKYRFHSKTFGMLRTGVILLTVGGAFLADTRVGISSILGFVFVGIGVTLIVFTFASRKQWRLSDANRKLLTINQLKEKDTLEKAIAICVFVIMTIAFNVVVFNRTANTKAYIGVISWDVLACIIVYKLAEDLLTPDPTWGFK